jgi:hypothetical protein
MNFILNSKSGIDMQNNGWIFSMITNWNTVTEYDEWDHIFPIARLGLFQDVMRNWRSSATATLATDVTLHTILHHSSSVRLTSDTSVHREEGRIVHTKIKFML